MNEQELIGAMVVRNEADRYLKMVLKEMWKYCDQIVVLDDASTDDTAEVCRETGCQVTVNEVCGFRELGEGNTRIKLWREIIPRYATMGESWILTIDADEIVDPRIIDQKEVMLNQGNVHVWGMVIYELWGAPDKIRIDLGFNPHTKMTPMISRWIPETGYVLPPGLHCGRVPINQPGPFLPSNLWLKHLGWADPEDIKKKKEFYRDMDPDPHPQMEAHYKNIMEGTPVLVDWWLD